MTSTVAPDRTASASTHEEGTHRRAAIACAVVAGVVHVYVTPEHLGESWLLGAFFVGVAIAQFALAWVLRRTTDVKTLLVAIWGTLGLVALYVASRTMELPFVSALHGSHLPVAWGIGNGSPIFPGSRIEPVGVLDMVSLVAELGLVFALVGLLPERVRRHTTNVMLLCGVIALALRGAGLMT